MKPRNASQSNSLKTKTGKKMKLRIEAALTAAKSARAAVDRVLEETVRVIREALQRMTTSHAAARECEAQAKAWAAKAKESAAHVRVLENEAWTLRRAAEAAEEGRRRAADKALQHETVYKENLECKKRLEAQIADVEERERYLTREVVGLRRLKSAVSQALHSRPRDVEGLDPRDQT